MLKTPGLTYRPDIDGLRAIAVLAVVGFHALPLHLTGGFVGVDIFFVISGYLISGIVIKSLAEERFSFAEFYVRRIKRIFPALLLVLAFCGALGRFAMLPDEYIQLGKHTAAAVGFVLNFVLWKESGYFDTESVFKPLLHLWSLSIEEQYYIVWPALLLIVWKRGHHILALTAVIAAVSFVVNVVLVRAFPVATFFMPFTRAWELMVGSWLACFEFSSKSTVTESQSAPPMKQWWREVASYSGIVLIAIAFVLLSPNKAFPGWWALLPTIGTFLIIWAGMDASFNRYVLGLRPLVFIGLISYPLYLWHWPLLSFAWLNSVGDPPRGWRLALVVTSFVLAWLTYALVERRIRSTQIVRPAIVLLMIALLIGGAGYAVGRGYGIEVMMANLNRVPVADFDLDFPEEFYQTTAPCYSSMENGTQINQCRTKDAGDPKFAVFGDSHARVLYPGVAKALPGIGSMLLQSCAFPLMGLTVSNRPFDQYCTPAMSEADVGYLAGIPSVKTVVLSFRGPLYLLGKGFGFGSQEREHDVVIEAGSSELQGRTQEQLFSFGVSAAIDVLERAGKRIVLVSDFPELGFDITDCVSSRLSRLLGPKVPECRIARSAVEARQKKYRAFVDALRLSHPKISVFDTIPLLCDDQYCYGIRDHRAIYLDDDHIGLDGSNLIGRQLAEFLTRGGYLN